MSISDHELLQYAEKIYATASTEVQFRACVGRAYYAAMLKSRDYHDSLGIEETSRQHVKLIQQMIRPNTSDRPIASKLRKAGLDLRGMKLAREIADYDIHLDVSKEDAQDIIERAQIIFDELG